MGTIYGEEKVFMEKKKITVQDVADVLDHSMLRPDYTLEELREGCKLAREYRCASVCVRPCDIQIAVEELKGTNVQPAVTIGFPHGGTTVAAKLAEAKEVIEKGATEIDMVINIGRMLSGDMDYIRNEIKEITDYAHGKGVLVKVIFETYFFDEDQIVALCKICEELGCDYVKTSTGYVPGGATIKDLKLMRETCGPKVEVKASGGVRNLDAVLSIMAIGVTRIGTRSSKEILKEAEKREMNRELYL